MKKISYIIYFILVVLIIYQDSPLGIYMGAFGYSTLPVLSITLSVVYFIISRGNILIPGFIRKLFCLFFYLCFVSSLSTIIWSIRKNNIEILGESVFIKSFKVLLYFFSYLCFLLLTYNISKKIDKKEFLKPVFATLLLITLVCIVENQTRPYAFEFIHFTGRLPYTRIRLFAKESSWTTMTIYTYSVLSLYYGLCIEKSKKITCITCICIAILIALTSSKTLMIGIFLTLIIAWFFSAKKMSFSKTLGMWLSAVAIFITFMLLKSKFMLAIKRSLQYGSIPTRIYTIFIGFLIGIKYPLGTGTAIYLKLFPEYLKQYIYLLKDIPAHMLNEIYSYINATVDTSVAAKSGLMQYNMYWGIIGTLFFLFILYQYVHRPLRLMPTLDALILRTAITVSTVLLITSVDFTFEFWLLVSFIIAYVRPITEIQKYKHI